MQIDTSYSVRPASSDDLLQVTALDRRYYPQAWTREQFEAELEKPFSRFLVITDDETDSTVVAYCVYWAMDDAIELLNLTVDSPFRGLGFAKRMLQMLVREAVQGEKKSVFLEVRKSNLAAIALYQRFGFEVGQTRRGFYADGEDAFHMRLTIPTEDSSDAADPFFENGTVSDSDIGPETDDEFESDANTPDARDPRGNA